jgi:hypothetical protein
MNSNKTPADQVAAVEPLDLPIDSESATRSRSADCRLLDVREKPRDFHELVRELGRYVPILAQPVIS